MNFKLILMALLCLNKNCISTEIIVTVVKFETPQASLLYLFENDEKKVTTLEYHINIDGHSSPTLLDLKKLILDKDRSLENYSLSYYCHPYLTDDKFKLSEYLLPRNKITLFALKD